MPELPEAEVAARQLRERVVGATVRDCWIGREDIVREGLPSLEQYRQAKITGVERKGKSVILHFLCGKEPRFRRRVRYDRIVAVPIHLDQAPPTYPLYPAPRWLL